MTPPDLSQLTIVVPTYQRHASLAKLLAYYAPLPVRLIVVDGSPEPFDRAASEPGAALVRYFHMPVSIDERIAYAAQLCDTEFAMFSCDDEYYLPQALGAALAQLRADPTQSASQGRCAAFVYNAQGMQFGTFYNFLKGFAEGSPTLAGRLGAMAACPPLMSGFYYSVCRTAAFRRAVSVAFRQRYACPFVQELLFSLCLFIQGPMRTVPDLLWLRNLQAPPVHDAQWNRKLDFSAWYGDPQYAAEAAQMRASVKDFCAAVQPDPGYEEVLDRLFEALLDFDRRLASGQVEGDRTYPFALNTFLLLARRNGLPVDEAGLLAAERQELELDDMTQLKARMSVW
jgi:glycosyltransferase domain-containing protein